jgi:hypothetical protein
MEIEILEFPNADEAITATCPWAPKVIDVVSGKR